MTPDQLTELRRKNRRHSSRDVRPEEIDELIATVEQQAERIRELEAERDSMTDEILSADAAVEHYCGDTRDPANRHQNYVSLAFMVLVRNRDSARRERDALLAGVQAVRQLSPDNSVRMVMEAAIAAKERGNG